MTRSSERPEDGFRPAWWLPGRHLETIVPALLPSPPPAEREEEILVTAAEGVRLRIVLARPAGAPRGTLLLLHGLGGSSDSGYMRRTARMAQERGWIAARMNLRTCGGTEALSRTLYNAGQSEDAGRSLEALEEAGFPRPYALAGFSLGGNLALRYAGMAGSGCRADAAAGINPPIDLELCVRTLERPENAFYHAYFASALRRHLRRTRKVRPVPGPDPVPRWARTLRGFDTLYTAPDGGYASAEDYYRRASAAPHLPGLRVPSLILSSLNDPFVPGATFAPHHGLLPGTLRFLHPARGGHVGYWQAGAPRFWAAEALLDFLERAAPPANRGFQGD